MFEKLNREVTSPTMDRLTLRLAMLVVPMVLFRPVGLNVARWLCMASTATASLFEPSGRPSQIGSKPKAQRPERQNHAAESRTDSPILISQIVASSIAKESRAPNGNDASVVVTDNALTGTQSQRIDAPRPNELRGPQGFGHLLQVSIPAIGFGPDAEHAAPADPTQSGADAFCHTTTTSNKPDLKGEQLTRRPAFAENDEECTPSPREMSPTMADSPKTANANSTVRSIPAQALESPLPKATAQPDEHVGDLGESQKQDSLDASGEWKRIDLRGIVAQPDHLMPEMVSTPVVEPQASRAALEQARLALQSGLSLARRRAYYSARARFVEVLRIVAQSLDEQALTNRHARSLANGMSALREAGDFLPSASVLEGEMNLDGIVAAHRTPILQDVDLTNLATTRCLQEYLAYAEQELTRATGNQPVTSQALFALAKLQTLSASSQQPIQIRVARAITLYQAALVADSKNFYAANELGVLLARYGQFEDARRALQHCLRVSPQEVAWRNLADVHERLGEHQLARLALREAAIVAQRHATTELPANHPTRPEIDWVDPKTFASIQSRTWDHQAASNDSVPEGTTRRQATTNHPGIPRIR